MKKIYYDILVELSKVVLGFALGWLLIKVYISLRILG